MSTKATKRRRLSESSSSDSSASTTTPGREGDLSTHSTWHSDDDTPPSPPPILAKWKGKGREVDTGDETEELEVGYPPESVEEAESRRITNNLKSWEAKEREKRRVSRDVTANHSRTQSQSVAEDVGNRASALWKSLGGRKGTKRPSGSDHHVLQDDEFEADAEDGEVQLSTLVASPLGSPAETPTPTQGFRDLPDVKNASESGNPFKDPEVLSASSREYSISPQDGVIMDPIPTPPASDSDSNQLHMLKNNSSIVQTRQPFPPQPLRLPQPKTPPPPSAKSPIHEDDAIDRGQGKDLVEPGKGKWWTEWLCGCSEGPDRGGDNQAGKTNPFE